MMKYVSTLCVPIRSPRALQGGGLSGESHLSSPPPSLGLCRPPSGHQLSSFIPCMCPSSEGTEQPVQILDQSEPSLLPPSPHPFKTQASRELSGRTISIPAQQGNEHFPQKYPYNQGYFPPLFHCPFYFWVTH